MSSTVFKTDGGAGRAPVCSIRTCPRHNAPKKRPRTVYETVRGLLLWGNGAAAGAADGQTRRRKSEKGKHTIMTLPMMYRSSTAPSRSSRLSEEWLRLSPMTNTEPSGTVSSRMVR